MTYYAALDVGLRTTAVCIVDGDGKIQREKSLPSEVDDIVTCLRGFGAEIAAVGLEAGTLTQWLTYGLRDAGFSAVVMEARHVKAALGAMRNKPVLGLDPWDGQERCPRHSPDPAHRLVSRGIREEP